MRVVFIKACEFNRMKRFVGSITRLTPIKAKEMIEAGIVTEYTGKWPPRKEDKIKYNLKDLK